MKEIASNPSVLYQMGMSARMAVGARFEQEAQTRLLESFYEEAVALRAAEQETVPQEARPAAAQLTEQVTAE
jgi:hypothetical protein